MLTRLRIAALALLLSLWPANAALSQEGNAMPEPKVILFDVNETLLDLTEMRGSVSEALGGRNDLLPLWFTTMLQYSLVDTVTGNYRDFADIGAAALVMTAEREGIALDLETARAAITGPITQLPPHPDVTSGLARLQADGYRIASLTNSSNAGVTAQFEFAGLTQFFERRLSVEDVRAFKPHPAPYQFAARELGVEPAEILMVAAHAWDIEGAKAQGFQTAFVARAGAVQYPHAQKPDFVVRDLHELADMLAAKRQ